MTCITFTEVKASLSTKFSLPITYAAFYTAMQHKLKKKNKKEKTRASAFNFQNKPEFLHNKGHNFTYYVTPSSASLS